MNTEPDGGPAFPVPEGNGCGPWGGMLLRDYFAGQALVGLLAGVIQQTRVTEGGIALHSTLAPTAYEIADAMLKARQNKQ